VMRKCACVPQPCVVNVGLGLAAAVTAALRLSFAVHLFGTQICGCSLSASRNKTPTTEQTPKQMQKNMPAVTFENFAGQLCTHVSTLQVRRGNPVAVHGAAAGSFTSTSALSEAHSSGLFSCPPRLAFPTPCSALPYKPIFCV
jgi:hypothetical protein